MASSSSRWGRGATRPYGGLCALSSSVNSLWRPVRQSMRQSGGRSAREPAARGSSERRSMRSRNARYLEDENEHKVAEPDGLDGDKVDRRAPQVRCQGECSRHHREDTGAHACFVRAPLVHVLRSLKPAYLLTQPRDLGQLVTQERVVAAGGGDGNIVREGEAVGGR
eukprot:555327-Pleurochrysis_carterae.AAC.1